VSESHSFAIVASDALARFPPVTKHHLCNYVPLFLRDPPPSYSSEKKRRSKELRVNSHTFHYETSNIFLSRHTRPSAGT